MIQKAACTVVATILFSLPVCAQSEQQAQAAEKGRYEVLVEKAKQGDRTIDFTEFRLAFFESPQYNPHAPMMAYRSLYGALEQRNYPEAIRIAEAVLAKNFVEPNAHISAMKMLLRVRAHALGAHASSVLFFVNALHARCVRSQGRDLPVAEPPSPRETKG